MEATATVLDLPNILIAIPPVAHRIRLEDTIVHHAGPLGLRAAARLDEILEVMIVLQLGLIGRAAHLTDEGVHPVEVSVAVLVE